MIIEVKKLEKEFGTLRAVNNISFNVKEGEIFGLLGPNGAGKTTTVKMLTTLVKPTKGTATVAGYDIIKDSNNVRKSIGIVFQDPSLDDELTGRENLEFHAILYNIGKKERKKRIQEAFKLVELEDKADVLVKNYSGGMKRRLEIGRGLLHEPKVLFLDEPTVGLDPQTRRHIWDYIQKLSKEKKVTLILTTHYIEEADYLCNRVAFIDHGKIVALDTPKVLKDKLGGDVVSLQINSGIERLKSEFRKKKYVKTISNRDGFLELTVDEGEKKIPEIMATAQKLGIEVSSVNLHKPSLEDVYIYYTGKTIRDEGGEGWKGMMRSRMRQR